MSLGYRSVMTEKDKAIEFVRGLCEEHAAKWGEFTAALHVGAARITKEALDLVGALIAAFWVPAQKGKAHRGHLEVKAPNGEVVKITRDNLAVFFGVKCESELDAKATGQSIQRLLQPFGAAFASFGANAEKLSDAVNSLLEKATSPTPSGVLKVAKSTTAPGWCGPLQAEQKALDVATQGAVNAVLGSLSLVGLTKQQIANRKVSKAQMPMVFASMAQVQTILDYTKDAKKRLSKISAEDMASNAIDSVEKAADLADALEAALAQETT